MYFEKFTRTSNQAHMRDTQSTPQLAQEFGLCGWDEAGQDAMFDAVQHGAWSMEHARAGRQWKVVLGISTIVTHLALIPVASQPTFHERLTASHQNGTF